MTTWNEAFRQGALAGSLASVLSGVALLAGGWHRGRQPVGPLNAISHWVWGDRALHRDRVTLRHTAVGYFIHHVASLFWSTLHAKAWGDTPQAVQPVPALVRASATAAAACFVDFQLTPHRLTPGFEHRLARRELAAVYACFAIGLALGTVLAARRR